MRWALFACSTAASILFASASHGTNDAAVRAWAFVAVGGIVGIAATRTWGRRVVGAALVLSGIAAFATAMTAGNAVAPFGCAFLVAAGVTTFVRGPTWRGLGTRYDAPGARPATDADLWTALDRGDDPTV